MEREKQWAGSLAVGQGLESKECVFVQQGRELSYTHIYSTYTALGLVWERNKTIHVSLNLLRGKQA